MERVFDTLAAVNVNGHTEKKNGLTYLTWSWAWDEVKRKYPDATYSIWKSEAGIPYVYDPLTGFMVYTSVTIDGVTHEMWLPVMDGANKAMKAERYTYKVKDWKTKQYVDKAVEPATMFDINKTIMRCLVKNLAMFGLGLYIYAGEDLPTDDAQQAENGASSSEATNAKGNTTEGGAVAATREEVLEEAALKAKVMGYINRHQMSKEDIEKLCKFYKISDLQHLTAAMCNNYITQLEKKGKSIDE